MFVSVSEWLRNGTLSTTISLAAAAGAFTRPSNRPFGTCARNRPTVSSARSTSREPIVTSMPARPSRSASPNPNAPLAPMIVSDVSLAGKRRQYRSRRIPARGQITCGQWPDRTIDDLS
jgi:hypothetical protein